MHMHMQDDRYTHTVSRVDNWSTSRVRVTSQVQQTCKCSSTEQTMAWAARSILALNMSLVASGEIDGQVFIRPYKAVFRRFFGPFVDYKVSNL